MSYVRRAVSRAKRDPAWKHVDVSECFYCEISMIRAKHGKVSDRTKTLDHIVPRCEGGELTPENSVMACYLCNTVRGNDCFYDFFEFASKYIKPYRNDLVALMAIIPESFLLKRIHINSIMLKYVKQED